MNPRCGIELGNELDCRGHLRTNAEADAGLMEGLGHIPLIFQNIGERQVPIDLAIIEDQGAAEEIGRPCKPVTVV